MAKKRGGNEDWDGSDSDGDDSDFEEEMGRGNKSAKRQKNNDKFQGPDTDNEDDRDEDDLFENEEERTRVMNLPELQREMILAELTEAKQRKLERKRLLQQAAAAEAQRGPLKSTREVREEAAKKSAIQELKAARERKAKGERPGAGRRKKKEAALEEEYDEEEEEEEEEEEGMLAEEYVMNEEDDDDDDNGILERLRRAQKSSWYGEEDEEATLEELRSIQLKSGELLKWLKEPHFKRTVPGCLVRVKAPAKQGPDGRPILDEQGRPKETYLVAQAVGIEQRPPGFYKDTGVKWPSPYRFGPKNEKTDLWIKISRGGSDRVYPFAVISSQDITDDEFEFWLEMNKQKNLVVTRLEVQEVKERLDKAHNYTYTSEDVRAAIEERKKKGLAPVNYALEKARLERELDHAVEQGDEERGAQLQAALDQLTENMKRQGAGSGVGGGGGGGGGGMSALNKRNKEKNFQTDFIKPSQDGPGVNGGGGGGGKAAETTLDPFSRRATRSRVYWNTKKTGDDGNGVVGEGEGGEQGNGDGGGDVDMKEVGMTEQIVNQEELAAVMDLSGLDMSLIVSNGGGGSKGGGGASSLVKNILGGRRKNGSGGSGGGGRGVSIGGARPLTLNQYKVHRGIA